MELVGAKLLHLLTQTVPSLKSPTGAFIASQTLIFRRKQIIRTHLLSETSSDYFCLVRVARIELTASEPHCAPLADTLVKAAHNIRHITIFRIRFFILFHLMSRSFVSIVVKLWSIDPDK